ncbi:MAG TPA: NADH-quinone oxidoreductase subunit D [Phycisphaerae bacterium]|nr:NADH-quinone oxidoreductase subunit D [Phycisphaerae bacterium]HRW54050.1 NADH-quinone oxidoreductase subunit D [Phycisphaerae bacterium]
MADVVLEARPDINTDLSAEDIAAQQQDFPTEEMLVNMGPQHPATHGVLRVVLRTDGEMVLEAVPHIGYLHRCAEKIGETLAPYQYIPYTDRMDYLAGMNNNLAFAEACEKLSGLESEVSLRAKLIRIIFAEFNRIASHLVAFGTYGLDLGAFTPFLYAFREREYILDLFESTCGARLTYSYITIGGVTDDLPDNFVDVSREFLDYFEPKVVEYNDLLTHNHIFVKRTANVGVISKADALDYALTGPVLRGSGVKWDLRKLPGSGYEEFDFEIPIGQGEKGTVGDCWDRYYVRIREMQESVRIIRQALDRLAGTEGQEVTHKKGKTLKLPADEIYHEIENPRGQLGFMVRGNGSAIPDRVKARGPSFCNLSVTERVCSDVLLGDMAAIIGSIDVVMGEVDR